MEFFATTITGLEDVAASELSELLRSEVRADFGKVLFSGRPIDAALVNYASKSVNRVFLLLVRERVTGLKEVEEVSKSVDYTQYIEPNKAIAVRAARHGEHDFTSPELAASVGRAIIESYKSSTSHRLKVNLDEPDVELYALVRDDEFFLGINLTGESLHKRFYRVWHHRAALPPTIAYCMVRLSGWRTNEVFLDPFCGGGTIPIEAALHAMNVAPGIRVSNMPMKNLKVFEVSDFETLKERLLKTERKDLTLSIVGSDASQKALDGAMRNLTTAGLEGVIRLLKGDVRFAHKWLDIVPDVIVTNPPFGVRMGLGKPEEFYLAAFKELARLSSANSRMTLVATKLSITREALKNAGWEIKGSRQIMYGSLTAHIIQARR